MSRHLKTETILRLKAAGSIFAPPALISRSPRRGVRYFVTNEKCKFFCGKMNTFKEGRHFKKNIIVRRYRRKPAFLQLYTYHFPKTWSAACVANRELIKCAQKMAHALEHDHSLAGIEWRIRFFKHYYRVFKGGAQPEPGLKPYSRFYQYTYVCIYRDLKSAVQKAQQPAESQPSDVTFEPISASPSPFNFHFSPFTFHLSPFNFHFPRARIGGMYSGKNVLLRMGNAKARAGGTAFFDE